MDFNRKAVTQVFHEEYMSDESSDVGRVAEMYENCEDFLGIGKEPKILNVNLAGVTPEQYRAIIDYALISIVGWSVPTLIDKAH